MKRIISLLSAALLVAGSKAADIRGYVVDAETGEALAAANVFIKGSSAGTTADVRGYFEINVADGTELTAAYVGYTPSSFTAESGNKAIEVRLQRSTELRDVNVYGSRTNFGVQSSSDGAAGIYVRGGNYDQNLITLDGSTLYNGEHLKGFSSSIIPDMVDNVTFYKGAFPARYGSRLSSVVDVGLKEGDFENYHGNVNVGMLLSAIHAEGPIWKGHTSFNIAARASYFNWIMQPLLDKVYDNPNALKPYSKMNYYDLNAKFVHKFSDRDKLTAVVYWGKDVSDASPSDSYKIYKGDDNDNSDYLLIKHSTINHWDNVMGSAYWTHLFNNSFSLNVNANISHYLYYLKLSSLERTEKEIKEDSYASFNSEINEASLSTDFRLKRESKHDIRWGIKGA